MDVRAWGFPSARSVKVQGGLRCTVRSSLAADAIHGWAHAVGRSNPRISSTEQLDSDLALREALMQLHTDQKRRWPWWRRLFWR